MKLRQKGIHINHKRTQRIYREQGLQLKNRRRRKKIAAVNRVAVEIPNKPQTLWAMDFIHDSIENGRKLKVLTVIGPITNVSPLIHVDHSITGRKLADFLELNCKGETHPKYLKCDNGPEFKSKELDRWCFENNIGIIFSRPGTPTDNSNIESFNGTFRNECLNTNYFSTLKDAERIIDDWWNEYNFERPQKILKGMTPTEYESMIISAESNL